jgi:hypothetical protein
MANIPGISGFIQPAVIVRDRVISRGVSIPGGLRIPCIMGEGLREETVVLSALGNGQDGDPDCSPTGDPAGRYFSLQFSPIISGRTELYLNNNLLRGMEQAITSSPFNEDFDYRLDIDTGCIELQQASIGDQDGRNYSGSTLNVGNGVIVDGTCGTSDLIRVIDPSAPDERWTVRAVGVIRDSNGDPIPGLTTFTVSGAVSGQLVDEFGQPILFHSDYYTNSGPEAGAASGTQDACADGFPVASSAAFGTGMAVPTAGDASPLTTKFFEFPGNLIAQGQALPGDELCIDGYVGIEIDEIDYDSGTGYTTLTLATDSLASDVSGTDWDIRATNLFQDGLETTVLHDPITGVPATEGSFTSSSLGKVLAICSGDNEGLYRVDRVTSSRRLRVSALDDPSTGFPTLADDDADGFSETGLEFHMLETNGVILFGINEGSVPFEVGDKFFIDVHSRVLKANDVLEARYIAVSDINDPEFFVSAAELATKHGQESLTNTLALGSRLAFENGSPFVLALQTKPPVARRTSVTLVEEVDSNGDGGFTACGGVAADCEPDDLIFPIPLPFEGLGKARPDGDTQVNIFVVRNDEETQIFPNKVSFYNPQLESPVGQTAFISSSDTAFSYTVINSDTEIEGQGFNGDALAADQTFSTPEFDFDGDDVGKIIVVQSLETSGGLTLTTSDDISTYLFGNLTTGVELVITGIIDNTTATVAGNDGPLTVMVADATDIQFFIKDLSDTTNLRASLMLHEDLVDSGAIRAGDGIRITYIDETDADFFDTNWFEAFEALEPEDCQIIVPLPLQNRSGIFRAAVNHVETMSSITIQKERVTLFGAQQGVTTNALLGFEEVAVEDIGVLEGVQGDDPEEVLDGNTEDLVNFKLSDNFTTNRAMYFYPDQIVRQIQGSNVFIDGYYMAAAAAGFFARTQNVAIPLTNKTLQGFSILRDKKFRPVTLNQLGSEGATVLQPIIGGGRVLAGRTTSQSGFVEDEEISVIFIRDRVKQVMRDGLQTFIGRVEDQNTQGVITSRVVQLLSSLVSQGLITAFENVRVERDKIDPRQWNVFLRFQPAFPINYIFVDIEVGVL